MKRVFLFCVIISLNLLSLAQTTNWTAKRIAPPKTKNKPNTWLNFRKDIEVEKVPGKVLAKIATDSKYWLWINGEMVVYEGLLKRGPNPTDTYYDEVEIAPFLKKGKNTFAVLTWYFGKEGFSHKSSGQAGLVFECETIGLISDGNWIGKVNSAFENTLKEEPNYRLPESNIRYNAQLGDFDWIKPNVKPDGFSKVQVLGEADSAPWNKLHLRPIPQWKDFGVRNYENHNEIPREGTNEWVECKLPYNCHVHPVLDIDAPAGTLIRMQTDNFDYMGLDVASVRAEYVTKEGRQQYESLGWQNGHVVKYLIPKGVKIHSLAYRETGFNTEFTGCFSTNDKFYERLWEKAVRTLYVTMRDTYMDCPDRERAQWWGDAINEAGEAFYALSPSAASISKKGILELINWQREDGTVFSPVPAGNWNKELPGQMLASVGYYGFWNYYLNTGDKETIAKVYKGVKRYLDVWELQENGILVPRKGEWYWGDWGREVDKQLLFNAWYYLALKGYANMSGVLGEQAEMERVQREMAKFKLNFNKAFWDGKGYRTKEYAGKYDDRAQALAVVSGLAGNDKYSELLGIFRNSYLSSPYMEKYVLEALFIMEEPEFGLERMKSRYKNMVDLSPWTTLYENFGDNGDSFGNGTNNHAWSGGGLTILAQYVCGIEPLEPEWKLIKVKPQMGDLEYVETGNETVAGKVAIKVSKVGSGMDIKLAIPDGSRALIYIPIKNKDVVINGEEGISKETIGKYNLYWLSGGEHKIMAR